MSIDTQGTAAQVAARISELADALAETLSAAVLDRLCSDLDQGPATSSTLVLELARARGRLPPDRQAPGITSTTDRRAVDAPAVEAAHDAPALPQGAYPDLADRLTELSVAFDNRGDHVGALAASMQSVRLYCVLAQRQPDAHLPGLAASLNNIGVDFLGLGHIDEACAAIEQSITIRRVLAGRQPERYLQDLAVSLNNYGGCLSRLGRPTAALAASREATEIRLLLSERSSEVYLPALASTLANLGNILARLGRASEARAIRLLATEICFRIDGARVGVGQSSNQPPAGPVQVR